MAGTQNQPTEYEQVCYNAGSIAGTASGSSGAQFGNSSSVLIAFWGQTPTARATSTVANVSTTAFTSTAPYGFATSTEGLQVTAALSTIIVQLKACGLMA